MSPPLAQAIEVTRRYGDVLALDRVSLEVGPGELVGLLGPNGAGKSTLINLFTGLRKPYSGRVMLSGLDPRTPMARRHIGVAPQETALPGSLRVGECVDFVRAHFPDPLPTGELLERFGLATLRRRQTGGLSGGQRRRLSVALAFVGRPKLVFLDEPTTGLDVGARHELWDAVRAFHAEGGTMLLTSHYLEEVEALAKRVVVLGRGRILADDDLDGVRRMAGLRRVSVTMRAVPPLPGLLKSSAEGDRTHLLTADADRLVRDLVMSGAEFRDLEVRQTSLEEAFLTITGAESGDLVPAAS
ncbi:ABC transporter ATP-binding protein [Sinosporangium siamense]|uniref:ABC transporter ATP-binding protein n=1 Tax=Sinosporangium siamense TaxID=1367973 RepID=A0A919RER0_9ACTN|nr:ABC transporter ATP-binding protein [Sinosporangium siamense]GII90429.1 ABC transporter ATP-binding protein [Sinosporangium siamense]